MESKCSESVALALLAAYTEAAFHLDSNETMNFSDAVAAALLTAKASRREHSGLTKLITLITTYLSIGRRSHMMYPEKSRKRMKLLLIYLKHYR